MTLHFNQGYCAVVYKVSQVVKNDMDQRFVAVCSSGTLLKRAAANLVESQSLTRVTTIRSSNQTPSERHADLCTNFQTSSSREPIGS